MRSDRAIALAGAAIHLLDRLVLYSEGRHYADLAVALIGPATAPVAAGRLLKRAAALWFNTDRPRAFELARRSAELYRTAGDHPGLATALITAGSLHMFLGRPDDAKASLAEAHGILMGGTQRKSLFNLLCTQGMIALFGHDGAEARTCFADALEVARALDDAGRISHVLMNLAEIDFSLGNIEGAVERGREAAAAFRGLGRHTDLGVALINLAAYLLMQGSAAEGRVVAEEALIRARAQGGFIVRACLQRWALLATLEGRHEAAAQLAGHIDAGYAAAGETREPTEQRIRDALQQRLEAALTASEMEQAMAAGAAWSEADAVEFTATRLGTA
jgi:tetratricopeptide (TPR) repeat protein